MAADGHPFSSSNTLDNVNRLFSTGDDTVLNQIIISTKITPGGTTITTDNGFATCTRTGAGDYTLTYSNAFASTPTVLGVVPVDTTAATSGGITGYVYSVSTTAIRIRISDDAGTLVDPDTAIHVTVFGA